MNEIKHPVYEIDKQQVRRSFELAVESYDKAAVLQKEVNDRLIERLDYIRIQPEVIIDIGTGTGFGLSALAGKYPESEIIGLDLSEGMLKKARAIISDKSTSDSSNGVNASKIKMLCADAEVLPLKENSCDLIFSNLALQWCNDLNSTFQEFFRVLRPGGLLLFTSFGPDTLIELRSSWAAVDDFQHVSGFIDMHHVGDALLNAGLLDPVMDTENFTLTYSDVYKLMRDLKAVGARNAVYGRNHSLTGKQHLKAMTEEYEKYRTDGVLPATYEVVYGHAWAPDPESQGESVDVSFNI